MDQNSIGSRLRAALQATNQSASELARACGFSRQNMQRFLDDEVTRSKHFPVMARTLNVPLSWLLTGDLANAPSWWNNGHLQAVDGADRGHGMPPHWRLAAVSDQVVLGPVAQGTKVVLDSERTPKEGDLIAVPAKGGHLLRRVGPTLGGKVSLVAVDGTHAVEVRPAPQVKAAAVVVGVLFASHS